MSRGANIALNVLGATPAVLCALLWPWGDISLEKRIWVVVFSVALYAYITVKLRAQQQEQKK